jgi:O-antigen ligase
MTIHEFSIRFPSSRLLQSVSEQVREASFSAVFWLTAFTLLAAMLLGGGTRGGFLSDAILQLLSIPLLLLAGSRLSELVWRHADKWRQVRWELLFCLAVVLLPLIQLIPLPPWLWTLLPDRAPTIAAFDDLQRGLPWLPISVSPSATSLSLAALLPPLAILFGTMLLTYRERRALSLAIIALGVVSAFVGLLQIAQGPASPWRFFTFTNSTEAVGFFANRNHFAALLYVLLLFAAVWAIDVGFGVGLWRDRRTFEARSIIAVTASFLAIVVLLAAQAMARSRAGMILTMISLVGACALVFTDRRRRSRATPTGFLLVAGATAVVFIVQFALYRVLERFNADPLDDARLQFLRTTIEAVRAYLPFGSGMGTFVPVYAMFEKPADLFAYRYINHAHNDVVEFCLEAGIFAILLMGAFVAWFVRRSAKIWLRASLGVVEFDHLLARAATLAVALVMAHSFVDYPLRTGALMAIFVFACGLMIVPLTDDERKKEPHRHGAHDAPAAGPTQRSSVALTPAALQGPAAAATNPPRQPAARWGEDVEWPEAWRKPAAGPAVGGRKAKPTAGDDPDAA